MDTKELRFKDEVFAIVGAAIEVHRALGHGFLEAAPAEALARELAQAGIPFEQEVPLQIHDKAEPLKKAYRVDFLVFGVILVEFKASDALSSADQAQLLNYLNTTGHAVGVPLHFDHHPKLEWIRM
ncbi:MAG: GxxExxY protein [Acidobacteria bacterium]|nr:GxxExxY protein [Acidobacteriota bacterium]MBI3489748.1 GxxExxY protein [Acidobacteriota bacterium]